MGSDGLDGARDVHERGGVVLAQDEATSAVWGMPGRVSEAGIAQATLPLDAIAREVNQGECGPRCGHERCSADDCDGWCSTEMVHPCTDSDYAYLWLVMTQSANMIDPSRNALFDSKLTPIARMAGALESRGFEGGRPAHLHRAVAEAMTINETSFFRDLKPFEMLRETILPRLIEQRTEERTLRNWSAASSTGQEAYSLAMMVAEHLPEIALWDVKVIGTDISRRWWNTQRGRHRRPG
jgi:hypothetical protein